MDMDTYIYNNNNGSKGAVRHELGTNLEWFKMFLLVRTQLKQTKCTHIMRNELFLSHLH